MNRQPPSATEHAAGQSAPTVGELFAHALTAQDGPALRGLLDEQIDFQALTPRRHWQATSPGEVVDEVILGTWFGAGARIDALEELSTARLPGRERVSYLLRVRNSAGDHLVEQQAYYNAGNGRITWMRILCSGYQKLPD
jgi:hypothetical protein